MLDLIASNPKTPTKVLRRCGQVSWGGPRTELRVAQNRSATAGLLGELAKSRDWEVRYVAAWHPKMPVSALRRLARDEFHRVRSAVACAASTPTEVLEDLAPDAGVSDLLRVRHRSVMGGTVGAREVQHRPADLFQSVPVLLTQPPCGGLSGSAPCVSFTSC